MDEIRLLRFYQPAHGSRVGVQTGEEVYDLTDEIGSIGAWLQSSAGRLADAISELEAAIADAKPIFGAAELNAPPAADHAHWLPPVDEQDVWAAGVTYERSREGRQEEAIDGGDIYARVYSAPRPELFFKARGPWVVGPYDEVGIRRDASWNVPEPELGLVANPAGEIVGMVVGNDMSSRDIEGENPLYLPQAKVYTASCALGPAILLQPVGDEWPHLSIELHLERAGHIVFADSTSTGSLRRTPAELIDYLGRCMSFPDGVVLLTGTGIVPPTDFTLAPGDLITIFVEKVGTLQNRVREV